MSAVQDLVPSACRGRGCLRVCGLVSGSSSVFRGVVGRVRRCLRDVVDRGGADAQDDPAAVRSAAVV